MSSFNDPKTVAHYAEGPARMVPGFAALQRMTALLLAERMGDQGSVLVLGAGGGLELAAFAEWQPGWQFVGVDPSAPMLDLARDRLGAEMARAALHQGYIDTAPPGPFDGATCLLTLHFVPRGERLGTLQALRARLKPGAALVIAHHAFPQDEPGKTRWLNRFAAYATSNGMPADQAQRLPSAIGTQLPVISPAEEEALLVEAGFDQVELFYAAFTFRGWVAVNPG